MFVLHPSRARCPWFFNLHPFCLERSPLKVEYPKNKVPVLVFLLVSIEHLKRDHLETVTPGCSIPRFSKMALGFSPGTKMILVL